MSTENKKSSTSSNAVKQTAKAEATGSKKEDKMYVGPTIAGVVRHSTVFKDGEYPDKVKACINKLPMMERLFVSMDELPKATKELRAPMSALQVISAQVAEKFKEV